MQEISKKNIIIFSAILFLFVSLFLPSQIFGQRELEVQYPEIFGFKPELVSTNLPDYVKYIFNFFIAIVGLIGFTVLLWAGVRYLTSSGKPEEQKKAKQQMKFALLGIFLLLFSYIILTTINPQLVVLNISITPAQPTSPSPVPISTVPTADLLERIKQLAMAVKAVADQISAVSQEIEILTSSCDCARTQPLCLVKEYMGGACKSEFCYSASDDQPCSNISQIREAQQKLVDLRDLILYYKNRALAEVEDLTEDIEKFINVKLEWYEEKINSEEEILSQCESQGCIQAQAAIIESLEKDKERLETEKGYKEQLKVKLDELARAIAKINGPSTELAVLPNQCHTNVKTKCQGSCQGGGHNTLGCFPVGCTGGNPCPIGEIQNQITEINSILAEIKQIADEIIRIVDTIPREL